ncbi:MAG: DUF6446 family protein [Pseudomonadota bacterium]
MTGRLAGLAIVLSALVAGIALYYLQVYHFYATVEARGPDDVRLTVAGGAPEPLAHEAFQAIDAYSSPIRYRACFTTGLDHATLAARYTPYPRAEPRNAPGWFGCFDAAEIGAALKDRRAHAFLGQRDITYGIDRVVAVTEDGRGFVWHQINPCGAAAFDGLTLPEGCDPQPGGS